MKTRAIAAHLADACRLFPFLGRVTADDLLGLVRAELGDEEILDQFRPYAGHFAQAIGPRTILHIVSGNTPHAALQSLTRGLLLGAHNLVKIPSAGLREVEEFRVATPPELRARVELARTLPDEWLACADAVIVFGSDETIAKVRRRVQPHQTFLAHGHRLSFGVVFDDPGYASVAPAAADVSLYDQLGCLSPQWIYVQENASEYARRLAGAMAECNRCTPRTTLTPAAAGAIAQLRREMEFRAANDPAVAIWQSENSTDWTVICEPDPQIRARDLVANRVVFVKPLPPDLPAVLRDVRAHLSTVGIWPATAANAARVAECGASRICPLGRMQWPPVSWHQDGGPNLSALVRWIDFEPEPPA